MTHTHTYAILEVSPATFAEIAQKLRAAGYDHAFDGDVIDLHGIAVQAGEPPPLARQPTRILRRGQ